MDNPVYDIGASPEGTAVEKDLDNPIYGLTDEETTPSFDPTYSSIHT